MDDDLRAKGPGDRRGKTSDRRRYRCNRELGTLMRHELLLPVAIGLLPSRVVSTARPTALVAPTGLFQLGFSCSTGAEPRAVALATITSTADEEHGRASTTDCSAKWLHTPGDVKTRQGQDRTA
jgi:hypothetical protein